MPLFSVPTPPMAPASVELIDVDDTPTGILRSGDSDEGLARAPATRRRRRRHRGMSLLEIMVVITLIGLVTAAIGVSVMGALEDGQIDTARSQAFELEKAVQTYKMRQGSYPSNAEGLDVLVRPQRGRPVIDRAPSDPWGRPYAYVYPGQRNPRGIDIISGGPDGQLDTEDDVGNWHES